MDTSIFTDKIQEADRVRDTIYSGMVEINEAWTKHHNQTVREMANNLKILFDTYGNISQKPLNERTSAIYEILQELKGDYLNASKIAKIHIWANELEVWNNTFEALMRECR